MSETVNKEIQAIMNKIKRNSFMPANARPFEQTIEFQRPGGPYHMISATMLSNANEEYLQHYLYKDTTLIGRGIDIMDDDSTYIGLKDTIADLLRKDAPAYFDEIAYLNCDLPYSRAVTADQLLALVSEYNKDNDELLKCDLIEEGTYKHLTARMQDVEKKLKIVAMSPESKLWINSSLKNSHLIFDVNGKDLLEQLDKITVGKTLCVIPFQKDNGAYTLIDAQQGEGFGRLIYREKELIKTISPDTFRENPYADMEFIAKEMRATRDPAFDKEKYLTLAALGKRSITVNELSQEVHKIKKEFNQKQVPRTAEFIAGADTQIKNELSAGQYQVMIAEETLISKSVAALDEIIQRFKTRETPSLLHPREWILHKKDMWKLQKESERLCENTRRIHEMGLALDGLFAEKQQEISNYVQEQLRQDPEQSALNRYDKALQEIQAALDLLRCIGRGEDELSLPDSIHQLGTPEYDKEVKADIMRLSAQGERNIPLEQAYQKEYERLCKQQNVPFSEAVDKDIAKQLLCAGQSRFKVQAVIAQQSPIAGKDKAEYARKVVENVCTPELKREIDKSKQRER